MNESEKQFSLTRAALSTGERAKTNFLSVTLVKSLAVAAAVAAPAVSKGAIIYETDGMFDNLGNGQVGWTYNVQNTDAGNMTSIRFNDVYSFNAPVLTLRPNSTWSLSATDANSDNLWELILSTSNPLRYLQPGSSGDFGFTTDYNQNGFTLNTGLRTGDLMFQGYPGDWNPVNNNYSYGLQGPTGVTAVPEPGTGLSGVLLLVAAGMEAARRRLEKKEIPYKK